MVSWIKTSPRLGDSQWGREEGNRFFGLSVFWFGSAVWTFHQAEIFSGLINLE